MACLMIEDTTMATSAAAGITETDGMVPPTVQGKGRPKGGSKKMPMPKKGSPAEGPAPSKAPAPEPAPPPPVADAKWSRLQPGRVPKCGTSVPATTAPGGGAAEGRRENDQAQNRPAGSRRERHVHVIRYFWCCRSCMFRNPSDRRNCIGCRLPAAGHRLYDPENPLAPSPRGREAATGTAPAGISGPPPVVGLADGELRRHQARREHHPVAPLLLRTLRIFQ